MARYLYSELASTVQARLNCIAAHNEEWEAKLADAEQCRAQATAASFPYFTNCKDCRLCDPRTPQPPPQPHEEHILSLVEDYMPSGSGFDSGTKIDLDRSHADKHVAEFVGLEQAKKVKR